MHLTICDLAEDFIQAAQHEFAAYHLTAKWEAVAGDIFGRGRAFDAIVSPANSFGMMNGGIDLAYSRKFGWDIQTELQAAIRLRPMGELLVGEALVVPTGDEEIPFLISAPTMRLPAPILDPVDVFLASRAAFIAARERGFHSIIMPGMGTLTGRVPYPTAAHAMAQAYSVVFS